MKKLIISGLTAMTLSVSANAAEVVGYTAPVAGDPANAADVDANFQALITAINDNAGDIAALTTRIDALENSSVSGRTYAYEQLTFILGSDKAVDSEVPPENQESAPANTGEVQEGFGRVGMFKSTSVMTFGSDNVFTLNENASEVEFWVNNAVDIGIIETLGGPVTGMWSQNGNTVTVELPDGEGGTETFDITVANGGGALTIRGGINGGHDFDNGCGGNFTEPSGDVVFRCSYQYEAGINVGLEVTP